MIRLDHQQRIAALSLGLGGVESRPAIIDTSAFVGRIVDDAMVEELGDGTVRSLIAMEDHVAGAAYRLALARVLIARTVLAAAADARIRMGRPQ